MSSALAIYPGSFDPMTMGHVDIIQRGSRLFDRIVIAVLINADKSPLFTVHERVDIAREVFRDRANVEVDTFDGLLVDYARGRQASVIVRGLRAVSDFEYEMQMALMNRRLNTDVETVFMMPAEPYTYVSSRLVKEVVALGGIRQGHRSGYRRTPVAREEARARDIEGLRSWEAPHKQPAGGCSRRARHAHRDVTNDEGRRRGDGAQGEGDRRHRSRRRRAGLSDAEAHRRGGARRHRRQLHEVHDQFRHR